MEETNQNHWLPKAALANEEGDPENAGTPHCVAPQHRAASRSYALRSTQGFTSESAGVFVLDCGSVVGDFARN